MCGRNIMLSCIIVRSMTARMFGVPTKIKLDRAYGGNTYFYVYLKFKHTNSFILAFLVGQ